MNIRLFQKRDKCFVFNVDDSHAGLLKPLSKTERNGNQSRKFRSYIHCSYDITFDALRGTPFELSI